jgi:hypothetical protein
LTLADKIAGDQALQMLVNSEPQSKQCLQQDKKKDNLATQATQTSRIADQKQMKRSYDFESEQA